MTPAIHAVERDPDLEGEDPCMLRVGSASESLGTSKVERGIKSFVRVRTRSTTTRDRNLQFRGVVSTGGSPLDFLLFLQYLCAI